MNRRSVAPIALLVLVVGCGGEILAVSDGGGPDDASAAAKATGASSGSEADAPSAPLANDDAGAGEEVSSSSSGGGESTPLTCSDFLALDGGIAEGCRGGDCAQGQVCCGCFSLSTGIAATSLCGPPSCVTGGGAYQLCASDAECVTGTCQSIDGLVSVCQPAPEAGSDGGAEASVVDAADHDGPSLCYAPSSGPCAGQGGPCAFGPCGGGCFCSDQGVWACVENSCAPPNL
jgi:hypothetical protein